MHFFVTGAAGFIGSNLVDQLLARGHFVIGYDNLSTGRHPFIQAATASPRFRFVQADLLELKVLTDAMSGSDVVFHLAANADVRFGLKHPRKDLEQNTIGTFNVLEAMRVNKVEMIVFSSTGSVTVRPRSSQRRKIPRSPSKHRSMVLPNWRRRV